MVDFDGWTGMRWNGTAIINWNYQNVLEGHWTEPFSSVSFHSIALLSAGSIPNHSRTFRYTSDDVIQFDCSPIVPVSFNHFVLE